MSDTALVVDASCSNARACASAKGAVRAAARCEPHAAAMGFDGAGAAGCPAVACSRPAIARCKAPVLRLRAIDAAARA